MNVDNAKGKIKRLQDQIADLQSFIEHAENYEADNFEQKVIKEYAFLGSVSKVLEKINTETRDNGLGKKFQLSDISRIIDSKPMDELHKYVR
jgi:hypothetical protein